MKKQMFAKKWVFVVTFLLSFTLSACSDSDDSSIPGLDQVNDFIDQGDSIIGLWDSSYQLAGEQYEDFVYITASLRFREFGILDSGDTCYTEFDAGGYPIIALGDDGNGIDVFEVEFDAVDGGNYVFYLDPISDTNDVLYLKRGALEAFRLPRVENISPVDINICE